MKDLELLVTLWPDFSHFDKFAYDYRLAGIRLNSAMIKGDALLNDLGRVKTMRGSVPLYFDIKGRQLRVTSVYSCDNHLELDLNHPIKVKTPTGVLFKAGADYALLEKVVGGNHLIFDGGPEYMVHEGESLHIREPGLEVGGPIFCDSEIEKIMAAKAAGFDRFFISYVEGEDAISQFRDYVGNDALIIAKIENKKGLQFVANQFKPKQNLHLMAARGDLYVEVDRPHDMMAAMRLIIEHDPEAYVGSRILLSVIHEPVPSCADLSDLAWLYDIGYKRMMLCDELCLKEHLLTRAVNVFESFRQNYANNLVMRKSAPAQQPDSPGYKPFFFKAYQESL